jgi:hypothetical protein
MHIASREEMHAALLGSREIRRPRRTHAAATHLDHLADVRHLRGTPHRRRKSPALALYLVAPIDVGIDLHDSDGAKVGVGLQHRDRDRIVATEDHRYGARCQHHFACVANRGTVRFVRVVVPRHVPDIDCARSLDQHRSVEVEVVVVADAGVRRRRSPDRGRRIFAIRPNGRVRRSAWRTDHNDIGALQIVGSGRGQTEKGSGVVGIEHRSKTCHEHSLADLSSAM